MSAARRERIVQLLSARGYMPIDDLVAHFRVTPQTLRADLNRLAEAQPLFAPGALAVSRNLLEGPALPFELTVVGNENARSGKVVARRRPAGAFAVDLEPMGLTWPRDVYSLAHVALPFPPDDPLYGATPPDRPGTLFLGRSELYGERGLLIVTANDLSRLRHNPFWPYVRERIDRHLASLPR